MLSLRCVAIIIQEEADMQLSFEYHLNILTFFNTRMKHFYVFLFVKLRFSWSAPLLEQLLLIGNLFYVIFIRIIHLMCSSLPPDDNTPSGSFRPMQFHEENITRNFTYLQFNVNFTMSSYIFI